MATRSVCDLTFQSIAALFTRLHSMNPLLSAAQVSLYLGISKRSLETLLSRGDGPRFLWVGCQRRWAQSELIEWTRARVVNPKKEGQTTSNE